MGDIKVLGIYNMQIFVCKQRFIGLTSLTRYVLWLSL